MLRPTLAVAALLAATLLPGAAAAHPHVWVTTRAAVLYDGDGRVRAIRHAWTFDEGYSAFAVQGLEGADGALRPDKLAELAKINMESLGEQGFFTVAKINGAKQGFGPPADAAVTVEGGRMTLDFTLPLKTSSKADRTFSLEVYDPTFFVEFALADGPEAVKLDGAPKGCALNVRRPKPEKAAESKGLSEQLFAALGSATSNVGAQFSASVLVACP